MPFARFLLSAGILSVAVLSLAAQNQPRYPVVAGITVEGARTADIETIIIVSGLRVGDEVRPDNLVSAIRNLWTRGQFKDVQVVTDRETALGVFLSIRVQENPRLRNLIIEGVDALGEDDVRKAAGRMPGDLMSDFTEYEMRSGVRKLYAKEGMHFAKITTRRMDADSAGFIDVVMNIVEGVEYYVDRIEFIGNKNLTDAELAGAFDDTKTKSWWQIWKSAKFNADKFKEDLNLLRDFFKKNGFVDAEIIHDTLLYNDVTEKVTVRVSVYEGPRVYLRNISFAGNTVYESDQLVNRLGFEPGETYNSEKFMMNLEANQDQTDVKSLYMDNGYLQAQLEPEFIRVTDDSMDVVVRVFERDRFMIRRVDITGNSKTREKVVRRELFTMPGSYFSRSAIIRSIRGLGVLNFFNPEGIKPNVIPVDNTRVDLTYAIEERSADTFNASVGFAGVVGLTGSVGITLNNFDITEPLRGGAGQIMAFQWEFGQASRLQTFQLSFTEPWLFNRPTTVGFNVFDTRQRFGIDVRRSGMHINLGRRFRWPDDFFRGDWSVGFERIESNLPSFFARPGVNTAFILSQTISRTSLDNMIFPTSGGRFSFSTRTTTGALGVGTTDMVRLGLNFDMFTPLLYVAGNPRLTLMMGNEMGYISGIRTDTTIPPNDLFYMGGNGLGGFNITPLRGYPDNGLGPQSSTGQPLGGRAMMRILTEIRFALSINPFPIYLLSFAEAGNLWTSFDSINPFNLKRSAGVGLRLLLNPIGLLGFDLGYGIDPLYPGGPPSGWQFHFQFGR